MGKVLKAVADVTNPDTGRNDAWIQKAFAGQSDLWLTYEIRFTAAQLAYWTGIGGSGPGPDFHQLQSTMRPQTAASEPAFGALPVGDDDGIFDWNQLTYFSPPSSFPPVPISIWASTTPYPADGSIATIEDGAVWQISTAGTSGGSPPDWTSEPAYGVDLDDGTAKWQRIYRYIGPWAPFTTLDFTLPQFGFATTPSVPDGSIYRTGGGPPVDWDIFLLGDAGGGFGWRDSFQSGGAPTGNAYHLVEHHYVASGDIDVYIDGTLVLHNPGSGFVDVFGLRLGQDLNAESADPDPGPDAIYFRHPRIGTSRGGADVFDDDFSSGNLSAWDLTVGDVSVVDDPFPPPRPPRVFVGAPWRIIVTNTVARTLSVLDRKATQRQFLFTLNGPAYHTGQVASDDPEINIPFPDPDSPAVLTHNRRLLYALRREYGADPPYVCRFAGIITNFEDQGADAPTSRYTAYDPWQYMMSRPVRNPDTGALPGPNGLTFPAGTRASHIAVELLLTTETVDGETYIELGGTDLPLVEATDPLADPITFDAGLSVGEAWQQLVATGTIDIYLPPMYEPFDFPGKLCRFQTAKRLGSTRFNAVMAWDRAGRSLAGVNRLVDGTRMANSIQYFAGQTAVPFESDATSITAYGEWWAQQFFPGGSNTGLVELMALAEVQIRKNGARSINLDPAPERTELVLRDYGLGDYLPVWASRNLREPLGIDYDSFDPGFPGASGYQRIFAIPIDLDDNGVELTRGIATASEAAG